MEGKMKKFEYRFRDLISIESLNNEGKNGWELINIVHDKCFFKREIQ